MNRMMRLVSMALIAIATGTAAGAEDYPSHEVRIILPYTPGGGLDGSARALAERLTEKLGQSFLVDNRPGAGGLIAVRDVATSPADGYTLFYGSPSSNTPITVPNFDRDVRKDFVPVAGTYQNAYAITVNAELPVKTLGDLVAYAKEHPGAIKYGANTPSAMLMIEQLKKAEGLEMVRVPYKGSAPATIDLLANTIQLMFDNYTNQLSNAEAGKVRIIALVADSRRDVLPDVPTTEEAGYGYLSGSLVGGFFAPAGTPEDRIALLNKAINEISTDPELVGMMAQFGYSSWTGTPEELGARVNKEIEYWQKLADDIGFKPN